MFRDNKAFTLSELLIAIAILGLIATFTIPKVLVSTQNAGANAAAKEVAAAITEMAHKKLLLEGKALADITPEDLSQFLQFARKSTGTNEGTNYPPNGELWDCQEADVNAQTCFIMNNGGCLQLIPYGQEGVPYQIFTFDPDSTGPLTRISFFMDATGRLTTSATKGFLVADYFDTDPDWFHWR